MIRVVGASDEFDAALDHAVTSLWSSSRASVELSHQALEIAQRDNNPSAIAAASLVLGRSMLRRGKLSGLLELHPVVEFYREHDEYMEAVSLCELSVALAMSNDAAGARRAVDEALEIAERVDDRYLLLHARCAKAAAMIYTQPEVDETIGHIQHVLDHARPNEDMVLLAASYNNMGLCAKRVGDLDEAVGWWLKAIEAMKSIGDVRGLTISYLNIATLEARRENLDTCETYLQQGSKLVEANALDQLAPMALDIRMRLEESRHQHIQMAQTGIEMVEHFRQQLQDSRAEAFAEAQARHDVAAARRETMKSREESDKLALALRQAERLSAIGRLAGGVAHDFNNLLTVIIGYADMILDKEPKDDPTQEMVQEIRASGERAQRLTHQLLAFSRKQVLQPKVLNLSKVVQRSVRMLHRLLESDIQLVTELASDSHPIFVDEGQLEQIIVNLAVNARDAMPQGGTLTLRTFRSTPEHAPIEVHAELQASDYMGLSVRDGGGGIDPKALDFIFEPFFTTKSEAKGTGLGLSTVYGIVKQSGGSIHVENHPGEGATFVVWFPRTSEVPVQDRPSAKIHTSIGTETILLVEDDDGVRRLLAKVLRAKGYQVFEATSAEDGLAMASDYEGELHLLLSDIVLPHGRGTELAEQIHESHPNTAVLLMSGYPFDSLKDKGTITHRAQVLQKPMTPGELSDAVRNAIDGRNGRHGG